MLDLEQRMMELARQGFKCSQILMQLGLDSQGKENSDLVRVVSGLAGGLGFSGYVCGALTGGVCLLSLYAGRGDQSETENPRLIFMINQLIEWFEQTYGNKGLNCSDIIGQDPKAGVDMVRCGEMVAATFRKVQEILMEEGISIDGDNDF